MNKALLFLLLNLLTFSVFTQIHKDKSCGTIESQDPYFEPVAYQKFLEKKKGQPHTKNVINLPLAIRIVRRSDGTGGLPVAEINEIMDSLNVRFAYSNFQFFQCGDPQFVDVNVFYDFDRNLYEDSLITYNIPDVINVYFISKIINGASFLCGYASFPWNNQEYVVVKNDCAMNGSTLAHEIGHYLGLYHTHTTINGVEYADGSNCVFAGDELCDTPADPTLGYGNVDTVCQYTGNSRDGNGDSYTPDPTNIMSYSRKECRTYFSPDQFRRMEFYYDRFRKNLTCQTATNIENEVFLSALELFPNPVLTHLQIRFESSSTQAFEFQIIDLLGSEIISEEVRSIGGKVEEVISLAGLSSGIYYLSIVHKGKREIHKFVKE
ncbi:MAG: T9SS type A sorting domain-containing protein [Bacteroidota bacterium]